MSREVGSRLKFISKIFQVVGIFQLQILRNANQKYKDVEQTRQTHVENFVVITLRMMMHVKFIQMTKTYPTFILVVVLEFVDNE